MSNTDAEETSKENNLEHVLLRHSIDDIRRNNVDRILD